MRGCSPVVHQVCGDLPEVAHVEIDMDANPAAARRLSVLSPLTTFIFDAAGQATIPHLRRSESHRSPICARTPVGITLLAWLRSAGSMSNVSARIELSLTKRRAVDLCRVAGCTCCCSC